LPAFKVKGNLDPTIENPAPISVALPTVTGAVPVDVKVTDLAVKVLILTSPKATPIGLMLKLETFEFSWIEKLFETIPALAVMIAVLALLTDKTAAVKPAVECPADTVTVDGTVTSASLLTRLMLTLLLVAAAKYTEQRSLAAPVKELIPHETLLKGGVDPNAWRGQKSKRK
jgi:hypothetical protein